MQNSPKGNAGHVSDRDVNKVVAMDRFRSGKSLSPLRQAEAYWSDLCDGQHVPRRSQIDPRGLENILSYTFMLERIAPGIARFRLAGQHLHELAGMEVRGMPITAFFSPATRSEIGATLEHVFGTPAIAELSLGPEDQFLFGEGRLILLPLRGDGDQVNRALGVLVADDALIGAPCRFRITHSALRSFGKPPMVGPVPAEGFAETQRPFLRVVK